ncbi:Hypothetical_protein [Hexamita inflata]|uniref:Hypothetical_protein n=1 Tax=Hexamita inflata TaxID=28002 RepID=A0AA86N414_9EUKA|nr:Hypothetical protein HINF_LOCUS262 [Hexamita inflata]
MQIEPFVLQKSIQEGLFMGPLQKTPNTLINDEPHFQVPDTLVFTLQRKVSCLSQWILNLRQPGLNQQIKRPSLNSKFKMQCVLNVLAFATFAEKYLTLFTIVLHISLLTSLTFSKFKYSNFVVAVYSMLLVQLYNLQIHRSKINTSVLKQ